MSSASDIGGHDWLILSDKAIAVKDHATRKTLILPVPSHLMSLTAMEAKKEHVQETGEAVILMSEATKPGSS